MTNQLGAKALFEKQVDCIVRGDRATQLTLYADDLLYEFPFAVDRPRRIEGRDAFRQVMAPLWEKNRQAGVILVGHRADVHETSDPNFIIAELTLLAEHNGEKIEAPFVQFFRTREGKIAAVREYFSPGVRAEMDKK